MNKLFCPYLRHIILVFFDNIMVYSRTWEEHLQHFKTVLSILATNNLFTKESKRTFEMTSVEYLGHIVSQKRVSAVSAKIQAIRDWSIPTIAREI